MGAFIAHVCTARQGMAISIVEPQRLRIQHLDDVANDFQVPVLSGPASSRWGIFGSTPADTIALAIRLEVSYLTQTGYHNKMAAARNPKPVTRHTLDSLAVLPDPALPPAIAPINNGNQ
jgi:hypothetical protein